jgi:hypothetical protein
LGEEARAWYMPYIDIDLERPFRYFLAVDLVEFSRGRGYSPEERVHIESVEKFWKYLVGMLRELAKG